MIIKMLCTFDYNPETNEYTPIGTPEIVKSSKKSNKSETQDDNSEPEVVLLESKYTLNKAAVEVLDVQPGDRINICYINLPDNPNIKVPVIASSKAWGNDLGNKLTKSLTVSYRGVANNVLAEYGSVFELKFYKDGLYIMQGDKPITVDDNIEVTETPEISQDLAEGDVNIDEDFATIEDDSNYEINDVDFNFDEK